jgi:hypothetical protein
MNNVPVPMDADRARVPPFRNRGGQNRGFGSRGANVANAGSRFQLRRDNLSSNTPCFTCGSTDHWSKKCPYNQNRQINLIDFNPDEQTKIGSEQSTVEELKARIMAMSPEEKGQLANEMGTGAAEDFHTV